MNDSRCKDCKSSPWIQRANQFVRNSSNPREQIVTVNFLLQNGHCGINNRIGIYAILNHLRSKGFNLNREEFQNTVLTELKRIGIIATLVYPGPQGGVFVPCDVSEIRVVATQVLERITQELINLEGVATQTQIEDVIYVLRELVKLIKELI